MGIRRKLLEERKGIMASYIIGKMWILNKCLIRY